MHCLNTFLEWFYSRYAYVVYRHAWLFLTVPLAVTACLSVGFVLIDERTVNDTMYLFTPNDGRNRYEKAVAMQHWPTDDVDFVPGLSLDARHWFYVVVTSNNRSNSNLFNNETLDAIIALNDYIETNFTLRTVDGRFDFGYSDICMSHDFTCFGNGQVIALRAQSYMLDVGGPRIQFPLTKEYLTDDSNYLGYLLGSVTVNSSDNTIQEVGAIRLAYFAKRHPPEVDIMSIQWRVGLEDYLLNHFRSDLIRVSFGHEDTINQGLLLNTVYFAPKIAVTFLLMLVFTFANCFVLWQRGRNLGIDWTRSKSVLAVFGVSEPGLAIISAIGVMLLIGMPYHPILVCMPFLVFAIGVDDLFIMISAWHNTKLTDAPEKRFSEAMSNAAVSITITSITDIVSFAIGTWNPLPGVQLFCAYTSLAFFFELVYQCTFFAAAMSLCGRLESESRHCITFKKVQPLENAVTCKQRLFSTGTVIEKVRAHEQLSGEGAAEEEKTNFAQKIFHKYYIPALMHPVTKVVSLVVFVVYLALSIWGCTVMEVGLQPEKLMYKYHYSLDFLRVDQYWEKGTPVQVIVSKPANISTESGREEMLRLVSAFENTKHTMGADATFIWLRQYLTYLNSSEQVVQDGHAQWCDGLQDWLRMDTRGSWVKSVRFGNESEGEDPCDVTAFRFLVATVDFYDAPTFTETVVLLRGIADRYKKYNVTTINEYVYPFVDQYLMVNNIMVRNGVLALVAMIVIALLMIPHPLCGVFITLATVSIDVGVTGFLSWWNVNMDSLSMMTMIMATGFAVDLSAHVSYAYIRAKGSANERVRSALEELGWPVFQGVTSTLLGVLVLGTVDAYMYTTFFKTVFLVIVFGLFHSLVFLPISLTVFAQGRAFDCCCKSARSVISGSKVSPDHRLRPGMPKSDAISSNGDAKPDRVYRQ